MVARLLASQLVATLAFGIVAAALGWQAYARTQDPLTLGLIGLAEFVPALILADRKSTRLNSSHVKRSRMPSSA